jgi:acyl-coenzyme A thioesterase PaaI-like protein
VTLTFDLKIQFLRDIQYGDLALQVKGRLDTYTVALQVVRGVIREDVKG